MSLALERNDYTYEDWLEMDNNERIEILDGTLYMKGEPSRRHQKISTNLIVELGTFLKGKKCELYHDQFLVRLNKKTIVHPDISVICDENKFDDRGCVGAPDLIVEILSPSNAGNDIFKKYNQYLIAGVKEYWIVDPQKSVVTVYILQDGDYEFTVYRKKDVIPVNVLPGCEIDLSVIFAK